MEFLLTIVIGLLLGSLVTRGIDSIIESKRQKKSKVTKRGLDFDWVITGGYVDRETITSREDDGWSLVAILPAQNVHPYAMPTDKVAIFSKYTKHATDDKPTSSK
jgi:hypothetical protein